MESYSVFHPFGPAHLIVIAFTIVVPLAFAAIVRRTKSAVIDRVFSIAVALLLIVNYIGYIFYRYQQSELEWQQMLPMQLCDWTMIIVTVALLSGGRARLLEVAYFWGIGGSLQAILTPNLQFGFPDFRFLSFFAD